MGALPDRAEFVRRPVQGGVSTDAQATTPTDALEAQFGQPATKVDLLEAKAELRREIALSRDGLRREIAASADRLRKELAASADSLRSEIGDIWKDGADLRKHLVELRKDLADLRGEVAVLRTDLPVFGERVDRIGDRLLIRVAVMLFVMLGAGFTLAYRLALATWPPG